MIAPRRPYVRRIRPADGGYRSPSGVAFPWLCLPHRDAPYGRGFRTHELAVRFADAVARGRRRFAREDHDDGDLDR